MQGFIRAVITAAERNTFNSSCFKNFLLYPGPLV